MGFWSRFLPWNKTEPAQFVPVYPVLRSAPVTDDLITAERLRSLLHYNPETGVFTWLQDRGSVVKAGDVAGGMTPQGYRIVRVLDKMYRAHRLAWFYMTGEWPTEGIDHINRDPADNRWANLRICTHSQNCANQRTPTHNTSGFKGVTRARCKDKWQANIIVNGKRVYLGRFDSPEDAHVAYAAAAVKYFGEFANPGISDQSTVASLDGDKVACKAAIGPERPTAARGSETDNYASGRIKPWNKPRASRNIAAGVLGDIRAAGFEGACTIPEVDEWITAHIARNSLDIGGLTYTPIRAALKKCSGVRFEIRRLKDDPAYEFLRNRHRARNGFVPERAWIFIIDPEPDSNAASLQPERRAA